MKELLYLKDDQIKDFIQLLFYAYRETVSDPKKYLEFCYGDWQTPKRTSDKREYLTSEHVPKLKIHNIFFQKLKNIFNK